VFDTPDPQGNSGVTVKMVDAIAFKHDPVISINLVEGWASAESRAEHPESSYTACVRDTIIGSIDACVGG